MPRTYVHRAKETRSPKVSRAEIEAVFSEHWKVLKDNPEIFVDAITSFTEFELSEMLLREVVDSPTSPVAIEVVRRAKQLVREKVEAQLEEEIRS